MDQEQVKPRAASRPVTGRGRWTRILTLGSGGLVVAGLGLYLVRGHLAAISAEAWLHSQGVESAIVMDELGWAGLGGRLSIGPAGSPDLTIDHLEVDFGDRPGDVRRVRLSGAILHVTLVDGQPRLGQLQRLIDGLSGPGARKGGPLPDVDIVHGAVLLDAAGQRTRLDVDGQVRDGHLQQLSVTSGAGLRHAGPVTADLRSAQLRLQRRQGTYDLDLGARLGRTTLSGPLAGSAEDATIALSGRVPDVTAGTLTGPVTLKGQITGDGLALALARVRVRGDHVRLDLDLDGTTAGSLTHPRATGGLVMTLTGAGIGTAAALAQDAVLTTRLAGSAEVGTGTGPSGSGHLTAQLRSGTVQLTIPNAAPRIHDLSATLAGPVQLEKAGLSARLTAGLSGRSDLSTADADRLARATPVLGGDPALHAALATALQRQQLTVPHLDIQLSPGARRIVLAEPVRLTAGGGGELVVRAGPLPLLQSRDDDGEGALSVTLTGGGLPQLAVTVGRYRYDARARTGTADVTVGGQTDFASMHGLSLSTPAQVQMSAGRTTITLPACTAVTVAAIAGKPENPVTAIRAALCPVPGSPLLALSPGHWRVTAATRDGSARLPTAEATVGHVTADLAFHDGAAGPAGSVHLTRATLSDTASPSRFKPVSADGTVSLAAGRWAGRFEVAGGRKATPLAVATLTHDMARQAGSADVEAAKIAFTPEGLQPGDLSDAAARSVWRVTGEASFSGHYAWTANGPVTSSGEARAHLSDFHMGAGTGTGLTTRLTFTGLAPLSTAPDQVATLDRIESVTPITGIEVHYRLTPKTVEITSAVAHAGSGKVTLDPVSLLLAPRASTRGQVKVVNVDIGSILSSTDLADKVSLKAVVAGVVPFTLGPEGLRVANGRLVSVGPGRLSIKRQVLAGGGAGGPATSGTVKDIAYQALENLAFDDLDGVLESRPNGRLGLILHIRGRHDPDKALPSRINLIDVLRGRLAETPLTLPKGTPVNLTLDTSINFDDLMQTLAHPDRDSDAAAPQKP